MCLLLLCVIKHSLFLTLIILKEGEKVIDTSSVCSFCNLTKNKNLVRTTLRSNCMFSYCNLSLYGGHKDEINCLVFSRDFEILLTGSVDGCIRIWNTVCNHLTFKIQEQTGRRKILQIKDIYIGF
jgi:WD40 repeat protein